MTDPNNLTAPGTSAGTTPAPVPTQTQTAGAGDAGERRFTQEEMNTINAKERRARERAEADLAKMQAQLAEIEKSRMSDQEKAIADAAEKARLEERKSWEAKLRERDIEQAIKDQLVLQGSKPTYARLVSGVETPEDAVEAVKTLLAAEPNLLADRPASQPGSPSARTTTTQWTPEKIREVVARGEYDKYRTEILAANVQRR